MEVFGPYPFDYLVSSQMGIGYFCCLCLDAMDVFVFSAALNSGV